MGFPNFRRGALDKVQEGQDRQEWVCASSWPWEADLWVDFRQWLVEGPVRWVLEDCSHRKDLAPSFERSPGWVEAFRLWDSGSLAGVNVQELERLQEWLAQWLQRVWNSCLSGRCGQSQWPHSSIICSDGARPRCCYGEAFGGRSGHFGFGRKRRAGHQKMPFLFGVLVWRFESGFPSAGHHVQDHGSQGVQVMGLGSHGQGCGRVAGRHCPRQLPRIHADHVWLRVHPVTHGGCLIVCFCLAPPHVIVRGQLHLNHHLCNIQSSSISLWPGRKQRQPHFAFLQGSDCKVVSLLLWFLLQLSWPCQSVTLHDWHVDISVGALRVARESKIGGAKHVYMYIYNIYVLYLERLITFKL